MSEQSAVLLANTVLYRPQVIMGGLRKNTTSKPIKAGWPWVSNRWRIWRVIDGVLTWHHGHEEVTCPPGTWVIHQSDRISSYMMMSSGAKWEQLRFAVCPGDAGGDALAEDLYGADIPQILSATTATSLRPLFADVLAWWWRDDWHRIRADGRLSQLLIALAELGNRVTEGLPVRSDDPFAAADAVWAARPLAPVADLALACGLSERGFRRRFQAARGVSPTAYARTLMTMQACDLMRMNRDWSVAMVSQHLGYGHPSSFIRAFCAELGQTPNQWRQQSTAGP